MVGKIEPRYGAEVYVSGAGKVCIKQSQGIEDDMVLIFEEDEVSELIGLLILAKQEIEEERRVVAENDEN
jgi:hypothetical protein